MNNKLATTSAMKWRTYHDKIGQIDGTVYYQIILFKKRSKPDSPATELPPFFRM